MEETESWLNEEFLKTLLKAQIKRDPIESPNWLKTINDYNTNFTVKDYEVKRAVEEGKNFSSTIYRVTVTYKDDEEEEMRNSYIVKKMISTFEGTIEESTIQNEASYLEALMKIEKYVKSTLGPKLYLTTDKVLVMNDLMEQGFENCREKLLDFDHCVLALKSLAKFHAGSIPFSQNCELPFKIVTSIDYLINSKIFDTVSFLQKNILHFRNEILTWPESRHYEKYFKIIEKQIPGYFEKMKQRPIVKVLNHGDFWVNNMMFKYENGKVCNHRLIDFQTLRFASPTCDFQYIIGSSSDLDVRQHRMDDLITVYLDTFNGALADAGVSQRLTKQEFEESLEEDNIMYIIGMTCALYLCLGDSEIIFNMEGIDQNLSDETSNRLSKMLKSKELRKFIPAVLDDLDKKGVFKSLTHSMRM